MKVVKRDWSEAEFDRKKILDAIRAANESVKEVSPKNAIGDEKISAIVTRIVDRCRKRVAPVRVEEIQDMVETELMKEDAYVVAKAYVKYRYKHDMARTQYSEMMDTIENKLRARDVKNQNANVDERSFGGRIGEMSSAVLKSYALNFCMSETSKNNHLNNEVYIHDLDAYPVGSHNCLTLPFDDLLKNGFNTRQTDVRPAGSINTAFQLIAVIFQLQSLQQFGGVAASHLDWTMVPYVRKSFYKHWKDGLKYIAGTEDVSAWNNEMSIEDEAYTKHDDRIYRYAIDQTVRETHQAVEAMYHNLNTLQSRSGNQLKCWLRYQ